MTVNNASKLGILERGALLVPDVAALFTEELQADEDAQARRENRRPRKVKPISERSVLSYIDFSQPAGRAGRAGTRPAVANRYEQFPMPLPIRIRNKIPAWVPDPTDPTDTLDFVRDELRRWWHERRLREV